MHLNRIPGKNWIGLPHVEHSGDSESAAIILGKKWQWSGRNGEMQMGGMTLDATLLIRRYFRVDRRGNLNPTLLLLVPVK